MLRNLFFAIGAIVLIAFVVWFWLGRQSASKAKLPADSGSLSEAPTKGRDAMGLTQVRIPDSRTAFSLPSTWEKNQAEGSCLVVTRDDLPGFRLSFSARSLPSNMPAKAFIAEKAEETHAKMYAAGDKLYLFARDEAGHAAENTDGFWWKVGFSNHIVGVFAEVPHKTIIPGTLDSLVRQMADVIESMHEE
jgi:hypothetical protein